LTKYPKYGRFVYTGVYLREISGGTVRPAVHVCYKKVRLVDATTDGNEAGIESNWLSMDGALERVIDTNPS
jgi:hypothetical protein